jgi:ABC-2 type transport system permease protein
MTFFTSLRKEMIEQWRTSRLLAAGAVLVFFGITSPLAAKFLPEMMRFIPGAEQFAGLIPPPTILDAVGQYVKNISQFAVLLAVLLSMGAVVSEKEKGSAALVLVKPLSRGAFLLSKFCALALVFAACILVAGLGAYYYTLLLFGPLDLGAFMLSNLLLWLYALVYVAATLLFSTLVRSQAAAAGLSVGMLLLFSLVGASPVLAKYLPAHLLDWASALLTGQPLSAWPALYISLGLIAASVVAAWAAFRRQEI